MDQLRDGHAPGLRSGHTPRGRTVLTDFLTAKRVVLKENQVFVVSGRNGAMHHDSPDGHGVWMDDTRYLSDYKLLVNGEEPEANGLSSEGGVLVFELASGPMRIHLERYIAGGLHDRFTFSNPGTVSCGANVDVMLAVDFAAMLRLRGILPAIATQPIVEVPGWEGFVLREAASETHVTQVSVAPDGRHHRVELEPGQQFVLRVDVIPRGTADVRDFEAGLKTVWNSYAAWSAECAHFETDNPKLNELIEQSRSDMRMLCDSYPTGIYPTGGLPWFAVPFGRDALFTSMFALPLNPDIARGALRFLAEHQGRVENADTEEQRGKILHEVRRGEVVDSGLWPHILYGTVDATPLFLCCLAETHDWTGDDALLQELRASAEQAIAWCFQSGDSDQDGWLDYMGARAKNQGWKDSDDSLTNTDGSTPPPPAALCEVQAYFYRGLAGMARVWPELKSKSEEIEHKFNHDFWMGRAKFVAQALDGAHHQVEAITSNPGHCLWAGVISGGRAREVSERLMEADLWSGWGVRTLSDKAANYDPCSYHNGSVWPHDCALAAAGMRRAGCDREA
ncbi:MAG TPA: glycogen debranching N-terminal domain-containing protein, partial [Candidatus Dormibacteraeota bacterium]|nr:glycogen debranching N-terminal domain-containing protein [Candidatus Dormibacteraeota bacterium]